MATECRRGMVEATLQALKLFFRLAESGASRRYKGFSRWLLDDAGLLYLAAASVLMFKWTRSQGASNPQQGWAALALLTKCVACCSTFAGSWTDPGIPNSADGEKRPSE
jgi:hypothetical protein